MSMRGLTLIFEKIEVFLLPFLGREQEFPSRNFSSGQRLRTTS